MKKIVVLLDGSHLGQRVLPHTMTLADGFEDATITLIQVLEPNGKSDTGRLDPVEWQLRKVEAQAFLTSVREEWRGGDRMPEIKLLEGPAASRIIEYIDETNPDLVMFSSHGHSGLSSWNLGSVAQKIIDRACQSFMLVPARREIETQVDKVRYNRILVPLDGSKRAEIVLPVARRLAIETGGDLVLAHATSPTPVIQEHTLMPEEKEALAKINHHNRAKAERYLAQMADQCGPNVMTRHITGSNVVDALLEFVDQSDIDLVVMAAHGSSGETKRPYGTVVSSFIAYGSTPLLLIQDLTQDQLKPEQAEKNRLENGCNIGTMDRTLAYAQPATWYYR